MPDFQDVLKSINSMPGFTSCFLTKFKSADAALNTLKQLSFVQAKTAGLALPPNIKALVQQLDTGGGSALIGGALTSEQRLEVVKALKTSGTKVTIVLADGVPPPIPSRKPWWRFW